MYRIHIYGPSRISWCQNGTLQVPTLQSLWYDCKTRDFKTLETTESSTAVASLFNKYVASLFHFCPVELVNGCTHEKTRLAVYASWIYVLHILLIGNSTLWTPGGITTTDSLKVWASLSEANHMQCLVGSIGQVFLRCNVLEATILN